MRSRQMPSSCANCASCQTSWQGSGFIRAGQIQLMRRAWPDGHYSTQVPGFRRRMLKYAEGNGIEQRQAAPGQLVWPEREFCRLAASMSISTSAPCRLARQVAEFWCAA